MQLIATNVPIILHHIRHNLLENIFIGMCQYDCMKMINFVRKVNNDTSPYVV